MGPCEGGSSSRYIGVWSGPICMVEMLLLFGLAVPHLLALYTGRYCRTISHSTILYILGSVDLGAVFRRAVCSPIAELWCSVPC